MNCRKPTPRSANALVTTFIVLAGVGATMALMSDRLVGTRNLQSVSLARQQATAAAEAVASLVETKLVQASGDLKTLTEDITNKDEDGKPTGIASRWLQDGFFRSESEKSGTAMWMGNSIVYWRVEPVKIYDTTIEDDNRDGVIDSKDKLGGAYTNNFEANPNNLPKPTTTWDGTSKDALNPGYYHFRIVTQSFYIDQADWAKKGLTLSSADPFTDTDAMKSLAGAQAQRMVQLKLINLFRYVIFYGAEGATGDIELNPGADLDIVGAVHSNGALYLGGQSNGYLNGKYHDSASSGSHIYIGSHDKAVTITGVDGIFRTRKVGNYHYQKFVRKDALPSWQDPNLIKPLTHELSGNEDSSDRVKLNGKNFTFYNDTRNKLGIGSDAHSEFIRDRENRNASVVKTLANIPQLSGYPFENQIVVGQGQPLYLDTATGFYTVHLTQFPKAHPLFYDGSMNVSVTGGPKDLVYATDLPLVTYKRSGVLVNDVMQVQPTAKVGMSNAPTVVDPKNADAPLFGDPKLPTQKDTFLLHKEAQVRDQDSGYEARGYYMQNALFGRESSNLTGLTIRERGAQNTAWPMLDKNGVAITGVALRPVRSDYGASTDAAAETAWLKAYSNYMARNYVVYFSVDAAGTPVDITGKFFACDGVVPAYTTANDFPAWETGFMNRREAASYVRMGFITAADATKYQVDVLTLNLARIQQIIRETKWIDLFPASTHDPLLVSSSLFNGMVYVHRTPRLGIYDTFPILIPTMPLGYHPLVTPVQGSANGRYMFTGGRYPILGSVTRGDINTGDNTPDRNGDPGSNVWSVFPSPKQVRVINGSTINWGGKQKSGRLQGLTVVTPNHCYIQGDYNTKADPVRAADGSIQYPPCGIYADGMTMLTNLWQDSAATYNNTPDGDTTTYNVSLVMNNIPTDNENMWDEGSGGTHNLLRFLEGGSRRFVFLGSMVVLNRMRYGRNYLGASAGWYGAPKRELNFNHDLMTAEGQPPFSPWGVQVTRVLSSVNLVNR